MPQSVFGQLPKQTEVGYTLPPLKNLIIPVAIDDAEIAECLAGSIETQCSHAFPPHDIVHISRIKEEEAEVIGIHKRETTRPPASYRPISLLSGLETIRKNLKTRLSDHLLGKGLIIDEQFWLSPAHSCPQQVLLRLVEYVSEGFETKRSTVAVFFDVAKAFDRYTGMSALTRQDVLSEQEFLKAPPLSSAVPRTQTMYRDRRRLASNSRYSRTIPRSFTEIGIGAPDSPSSPPEGH
ncbi:Probable RNA-directed DNA polymerase from transposon BS [Eumeta japonica]|uniref:Probable RNA-directed DNA polymerase from transposon BS n=1 Tax=Eumeta variegata TaxID=151549 RepID=A0A4C1YZW2_EUMVA|nr:Probable RNA-directed DNA polymerase from transposon BS [Eumeta japonica]